MHHCTSLYINLLHCANYLTTQTPPDSASAANCRLLTSSYRLYRVSSVTCRILLKTEKFIDTRLMAIDRRFRLPKNGRSKIIFYSFKKRIFQFEIFKFSNRKLHNVRLANPLSELRSKSETFRLKAIR